MTRKSSRKRQKPQRSFKEYLKFLIVAVLLIVLVDYVFFEGERPYITKIKQNYYAEQAAKGQQSQEVMEELLPPKIVLPEDGAEYFEAPEELEGEQSSFVEEEWDVIEKDTEVKRPAKSDYKRPQFTGEKAKIAIVIDDVGMNLKQSRAAIHLDPNVTIALLPYAKTVKEMAAQAKANGNEIIIHTPMEAMSSEVSLGSMALKSDMDFAAFDVEFNRIAGSFEGYVGVNNHMGSRLTQNPEAMGYLMDQLKQRGLYFLDSRTIHTSIAADMAKTYGIPFAVRDVFLDHESTPEFVSNALKNVERIAREQGSAIAIGHPKAITMQALQNWIPNLEEKGFELVALSKVLDRSNVDIKFVENQQAEEASEVAPAAGETLDLEFSPSFAPSQWHSQLPE